MHIGVEGRPLRPTKAETQYLIKRVEDELKRHQGVLKEEDLAEFQEALAVYKELDKTADGTPHLDIRVPGLAPTRSPVK